MAGTNLDTRVVVPPIHEGKPMFLFGPRSRIVHAAVIDSVPLLNLLRRSAEWPSFDEVASYPSGSFGHELARFLAQRGLHFLPQYEAHDAVHLLLGYETDLRGELELQAFMWGNGSPSIAGRMLFLWGGAMLPEYWPAMRRALRRGRGIAPLDPDTLVRLLRTPFETVRSRALRLHRHAYPIRNNVLTTPTHSRQEITLRNESRRYSSYSYAPIE